ncbi:DUF6624 domain-containing protein [Lewinella sp. W8]|uniref:DUF6624 domain-containing protein n=1 Tax=Lewinella sp. W8 TaxID=2528208 RepID=UPI0010685CE3|nr:DUF6624 domain-containing protein [Lewinella sp. W8]MTB53323.1 hypothetical protein [Lewinella sp. W8]
MNLPKYWGVHAAVFFAVLIIFMSCENYSAISKNALDHNPDFTLFQDSLASMVARDQAVQFAHTEGQSARVRDSLYRAKDSIFRVQSDIVKEMFDRHGFLDTTMVGSKGSYNFWLLVQHADHDPDFQRRVLEAMAPLVKEGLADASNYAYLTDRVRKNAGEKILYGTQVSYTDDFWVIPLPLEDSLHVNERRAAVGLDPIEAYLNSMMELHFRMNEKVYRERGMDGPNQYSLREEK